MKKHELSRHEMEQSLKELCEMYNRAISDNKKLKSENYKQCREILILKAKLYDANNV